MRPSGLAAADQPQTRGRTKKLFAAALAVLAGPALFAANVTLSWTDNANGETGYAIERSSDGFYFAQIDSTAANTTDYVDNGLSPGNYWYRVRAFNDTTVSDYSEVVYCTVSADSGNGAPADTPPLAGRPAPPVVPAPNPTTSSPVLSGTVIASGAWGDQPAYAGVGAFDDNPLTFFSGKWTDPLVFVGLDFGSPQIIDRLSFLPRPGLAWRMNGGRFCGANRSDLADRVTLYTIPSVPEEGDWQNVSLPNSSAGYRYVFFTTDPGNYGDVAELKFSGHPEAATPAPPPGSVPAPAVALLTGQVFSSAPWGNILNYDGDKAFDGNIDTFFAGRATDGFVHVGLDLGTSKIIDAISFFPRPGLNSRMNGGEFRGANRDDLGDAVTLYTITFTPPDGAWQDITLPASAAKYRYVFYTAPSELYGDVAELEFFGR